MRNSSYSKLGLSALMLGLLAGCGGGGGSGTQSDATVTPVTAKVTQASSSVQEGASFVMSASATSQPNAMTTMGWTVTKLSATAPDLTLSNGDCADSTRSGKTINGITQSNWACDAVLTAPTALTANATYRVTFTGTDSAGNTGTDYRDIVVTSSGTVGPGTAAAPTATTTPTVTVTSGDDVGLACQGAGGTLAGGSKYVYSWVVASNPSGLPISLSADSVGGVAFKAPAVRSTSQMTLQCRVTDDNFLTGTAEAVVTVAPNGTVDAIANAGSSQNVPSNVTVQLDASQSSAPGNPVLYYKWTQTEGPTVTLSSDTAVSPSFVSPQVSTNTRLTFQLVAMPTSPANASQATPSEIATVSVYVSPLAPLTLSISAASVVSSSSPVSLTVSASPGGSQLYYMWTQVEGPTVELGGANTPTASFISPTVSGSSVQQRFQVSVSRVPIATADPSEIYSTDVIVQTNP